MKLSVRDRLDEVGEGFWGEEEIPMSLRGVGMEIARPTLKWGWLDWLG